MGTDAWLRCIWLCSVCLSKTNFTIDIWEDNNLLLENVTGREHWLQLARQQWADVDWVGALLLLKKKKHEKTVAIRYGVEVGGVRGGWCQKGGNAQDCNLKFADFSITEFTKLFFFKF